MSETEWLIDTKPKPKIKKICKVTKKTFFEESNQTDFKSLIIFTSKVYDKYPALADREREEVCSILNERLEDEQDIDSVDSIINIYAPRPGRRYEKLFYQDGRTFYYHRTRSGRLLLKYHKLDS